MILPIFYGINKTIGAINFLSVSIKVSTAISAIKIVLTTVRTISITASAISKGISTNGPNIGIISNTRDIKTLIADTKIDGIICKKCNHKLPCMRLKEHLVGVNKECPHDTIELIEETEYNNEINKINQ